MRRKQQNEPKQAMRTVGVKIPLTLWEELNREVQALKKANPSHRYTVSDVVRERLCNGN